MAFSQSDTEIGDASSVVPVMVHPVTSFARFPQLPKELQEMIWEYSIVRREVFVTWIIKEWTEDSVASKDERRHISERRWIPISPPPALLHVCFFSREIGKTHYNLRFGGLRTFSDATGEETIKLENRTYFDFDLDVLVIDTRDKLPPVLTQFTVLPRLECDEALDLASLEIDLRHDYTQPFPYGTNREIFNDPREFHAVVNLPHERESTDEFDAWGLMIIKEQDYVTVRWRRLPPYDGDADGPPSIQLTFCWARRVITMRAETWRFGGMYANVTIIQAD
jgi:hypothetical protein